MNKANTPTASKALDIARESMTECQWIVGGMEAALNLMYRGLDDKEANEEAIAAVGMLRRYFRDSQQKLRELNTRFEQQLQQGGCA